MTILPKAWFLIIVLCWSQALLSADPSVLFDAAVRERAKALSAAVEAGAVSSVVTSLDALAEDPDLTPAQRDAAAWDLVRRLRRLDVEQVPRALMDRLSRWSPQAFRRHEESPSWQMPLFDVARAARGLDNQWMFGEGVRDAIGQGADLLDWSERYLVELDEPYGRGVRAGLMEAPEWQLDKLLGLSLEHAGLQQHLLPEVWLANGNMVELGTWLSQAPEHRVTQLLAEAQALLPAADFLALGDGVLHHPSASMRALAMARQTDAWLTLEAWPSSWAQTLWLHRADPASGAAAELQLVRIGAPARWQANPASAPAGVMGSEAFEQLQSMARSLQASLGGGQ
ncbi:MAG: hypothetical protein AAGJ52_10820 [Pseudomonadota bacterium]